MTALRLFDTEELPAPNIMPMELAPDAVLRAYCSWCRDFTVEPETNCCAICQRQRSTKYEYVEVGDDD